MKKIPDLLGKYIAIMLGIMISIWLTVTTFSIIASHTGLIHIERKIPVEKIVYVTNAPCFFDDYKGDFHYFALGPADGFYIQTMDGQKTIFEKFNNDKVLVQRSIYDPDSRTWFTTNR